MQPQDLEQPAVSAALADWAGGKVHMTGNFIVAKWEAIVAIRDLSGAEREVVAAYGNGLAFGECLVP